MNQVTLKTGYDVSNKNKFSLSLSCSGEQSWVISNSWSRCMGSNRSWSWSENGGTGMSRSQNKSEDYKRDLSANWSKSRSKSSS